MCAGVFRGSDRVYILGNILSNILSSTSGNILSNILDILEGLGSRTPTLLVDIVGKIGIGSRLDSGDFAGLSRGFRGAFAAAFAWLRGSSVGVFTVVVMPPSWVQREVLVGLSGHTCDSKHIMSADCVRCVRGVRDGTSDVGSSFVCLKWHSVPIQ